MLQKLNYPAGIKNVIESRHTHLICSDLDIHHVAHARDDSLIMIRHNLSGCYIGVDCEGDIWYAPIFEDGLDPDDATRLDENLTLSQIGFLAEHILYVIKHLDIAGGQDFTQEEWEDHLTEIYFNSRSH